jgi:cell division protein FtsW (lipid II flippase)
MSILALVVMGVPLPFVSSGGRLLLSLFIGICILVSAQARRKFAHS